LSIVLAAILLVTFGYVIITGADSSGATAEALIDASPQAIGLTLFETYLFPFEVASVLLLVAMVGVVVLRTKRGKDG
jgi:NADH-quinone oxidoreductase subunit J